MNKTNKSYSLLAFLTGVNVGFAVYSFISHYLKNKQSKKTVEDITAEDLGAMFDDCNDEDDNDEELDEPCEADSDAKPAYGSHNSPYEQDVNLF